MKKSILINNFTYAHGLTVPAEGYELFRDVLLPELLGKEQASILYWAGKKVARQYPLDSVQTIIDFFKRTGWGDLSLVKEKKNSYLFSLTGELISKRFESKKDVLYQLEAGFLAEQLQMQSERITEAYEEVFPRKNQVLFTVQWDTKK